MSHVELRVYILFNQRKADCMKLTVHKADLNSSRRNDLLQIFQFSIVKRENFLHKNCKLEFLLSDVPFIESGRMLAPKFSKKIFKVLS